MDGTLGFTTLSLDSKLGHWSAVANVNNRGLSTGPWNAIDTDALDTLTDSRQEGCHNPWQFAERVFRGPHRRRIGP